MSQKYPGGFITKSPPALTGSAAKGVWTLDQAMQLQKQGLWPAAPPTTIGQAYGGGYYAGQIGVAGVATHYIVVAPVSSGETTLQWKNASSATPGTDSDIDGPQNTADMVADGNATVYPAGHFCNNLSTGGQTDWYMPAKNELEICYYNLKPNATGTNNPAAPGTNPNAVPARASNYTTTDPPQTSVAIFQTGGAEAFDLNAGDYWCSTEFQANTNYGRFQEFTDGSQNATGKPGTRGVRAIRRVPV